MKKIKSALLLSLFTTLCFILLPLTPDAASIPTVKKTLSDVVLFDASLQEKIMTIPPNSVVVVHSEVEGWSNISYENTLGFVKSENINVIDPLFRRVKETGTPIVYEKSLENSTVKGKLPLNSIVEIYLVESSSFAVVRYGNLTGYVLKNNFAMPTEQIRIVKEANGITVRQTASPTGDVVGKLPKDTKVTMLTNLNGWVFVTTKEMSGYVVANGLKIVSPPLATPKPTPNPTPVKKKLVALTFDDGPHQKVTPQILKTLKKYDAKATFFVLGSNAKKYPTILKEVYKAGHEIGNHTYNHADLTKLNKQQVQDEINKSDEAIKAAIGKNSTLFRPPYGASNKDISSQLTVPNILWTIDTLDWKHHNPELTLQNVNIHVKNGSIILMHDIHQTTADALDSVLASLKKQGYELVTVSELLKK